MPPAAAPPAADTDVVECDDLEMPPAAAPPPADTDVVECGDVEMPPAAAPPAADTDVVDCEDEKQHKYTQEDIGVIKFGMSKNWKAPRIVKENPGKGWSARTVRKIIQKIKKNWGLHQEDRIWWT